MGINKITKEPEIMDTEKQDTEESEESHDWNLEEISEHQQKDEVLGILWAMKNEDTEKPKWEQISAQNQTLKVYWAQWEKIQLRCGVLYRIWISKTKGEIWQLLLPSTWRAEVVKMLHDDPISGHFGLHRTAARVVHRFYRANYKSHVANWCRQYDACKARRRPMKQYLVGAPMERVAIDILGPLPKTVDDNRYLLVLNDYFSRWAEAYTLPN